MTTLIMTAKLNDVDPHGISSHQAHTEPPVEASAVAIALAVRGKQVRHSCRVAVIGEENLLTRNESDQALADVAPDASVSTIVTRQPGGCSPKISTSVPESDITLQGIAFARGTINAHLLHFLATC